jgi:hypothetical protein
MSHARSSAVRLALVASIALALGAGLLAAAPTAVNAAPAAKTTTVSGTPAASALHGVTDPTFDGVFRQSLALLGRHAAGSKAPAATVRWLLDQQCDDGSFPSFRANTSGNCPAYDPATFKGGTDTNATALAAQALLAAGRTAEGRNAALALQRLQQPDGGWEFTPGAGFGTDPNSTGLALSALDAAGLTPTRDATAYLADLQVGRTIPVGVPGDEGGLATPFSGGAPDVLATVQSVPGLLGANLVAVPVPAADAWADAPRADAGTPPATPAGIGGWAAAWTAEQIDAGEVTDNDLAWAVLTLAADGSAEDAAKAAYAKLRGTVLDIWTDPAALGQAALAARTMGRTDDLKRFAALIKESTSVAPSATLRSLKGKVTRARARNVVGSVTAGTYGAGTVCVRTAERRKSRWYSFDGSTTWKKRKSGSIAIAKATLVCVPVRGGEWQTKLRKVRTGSLVVRWYVTDGAAGRSETRQRIVKVRR